MRLNPPTIVIFLISFVLATLALITKLGFIPVPRYLPHQEFWPERPRPRLSESSATAGQASGSRGSIRAKTIQKARISPYISTNGSFACRLKRDGHPFRGLELGGSLPICLDVAAASRGHTRLGACAPAGSKHCSRRM